MLINRSFFLAEGRPKTFQYSIFPFITTCVYLCNSVVRFPHRCRHRHIHNIISIIILYVLYRGPQYAQLATDDGKKLFEHARAPHMHAYRLLDCPTRISLIILRYYLVYVGIRKCIVFSSETVKYAFLFMQKKKKNPSS